MTKRLFFLPVLLLLCACLGGCSASEVNRSLLLVGVAIDFEDGQYHLYAENGTLTGSSNESYTGVVLQATGPDLATCLEGLYRQTGKEPYLSHARLILFSERLAKTGALPAVSYLVDHAQVRLNSMTAVYRGDMEQCLEKRDTQEVSASLTLLAALQHSTKEGRPEPVELYQLCAGLMINGHTALPCFTGDKEKVELNEGYFRVAADTGDPQLPPAAGVHPNTAL